MSQDTLDKLDNPVWNALNTSHSQYAVGQPHVKCYQSSILAFVGYEQGISVDLSSVDDLVKKEQVFFMVGDLPVLPPHWKVVKELPCLQMVLQLPVKFEDQGVIVSELRAEHSAAMFDLVNRVQPGLYQPDTRFLGNYYGVWQDDKLVAIAGERMRVDNMVELSAICTDPAYTGRKYAQHLIAHLCSTNSEKGNIPFLHVLQSNERAIKVYDYMGFTTRRMINFHAMIRS